MTITITYTQVVLLIASETFRNPEFERSMTGHRRPSSIESFWEHCSGLEEWRDHPALNDSNVKWSSSCVPTLCQEF